MEKPSSQTPATSKNDALERNASPAAKLRVAFFSDSLPERNGTGAYYHDLVGQLAPEVAAIEVFQPLDQVRYLRLSIPMPGDPMQRLTTPNLIRIAKGYRALQPDLVVAVTPGPFGLLGLYHARRSGARFITAFHTDFEQLARIYWRPLSRSICNAYLRTANRYLCKHSATVLVNNSKLRSDVEQLGAKHVEVMGTPLQPSFLSKAMRPPPDVIQRICFAGRLAAEKNVDQIIAAAAHFPDIEFVIGGEGPLRRSLEASAAALNNVRFTGWLTREELIDLLDSASFLLLPSKLETFGSVALEAMARGRPALVSANAGIHDWPLLRAGLIALPKGQDLADAIRALLQLSTTELHHKARSARNAAEQLNRETIGQWASVLANYASHAPPR